MGFQAPHVTDDFKQAVMADIARNPVERFIGGRRSMAGLRLRDRLKEIEVPTLVMGVPGIAIITRLVRASTLEVISQDYVRTARAKGLTEFTVQRRHVLRNSMIPVITVLGFSLAGLFFTSFIVERFFGIPGMGSLFIEAIFARDFPIINAVIIVGTTLFVLANLMVDLIYPWLDPRIRLGGSYAN